MGGRPARSVVRRGQKRIGGVIGRDLCGQPFFAQARGEIIFRYHQDDAGDRHGDKHPGKAEEVSENRDRRQHAKRGKADKISDQGRRDEVDLKLLKEKDQQKKGEHPAG